MKKITKLQGFKGGGGGSPSPSPSTTTTPATAVEVEDTIRSTGKAYIVDLLCEGEIEGLVNLYIDEAVYNSTDFPTVTFDSNTMFRRGLPRTSQAILPDRFAGAKVPIPIPQSNRLKKTRPIILYFNSNTYPDATSVLINVRFPSMLKQVDEANREANETLGDIRQTKVEYHVTLTENGSTRAPVVEVVDQKSSGGFIWSTRVALAPNSGLAVNQWKLRIDRITDDSTSVKISNDTYLDSVIIETSYNYNYPNSVVGALTFDALNYPSIGQRAYDLKLMKVKVPNGYTPTQYDANGNVVAAASYPGTWNGTFNDTKVWTDNPAWIFYDLLTNKRYGLGEFISENNVDKWTLYSIAKYCDELVSKGTGESGDAGMEPRFACNLFLTTSEEAYTVMNNLASVFRGITYWMSGKIFPVQDRPKTSTQLFTNANVINGLFNYSSSGKGQRRTAVQVRWNDPQDFYRPAVEYVEDVEGIIRFGVRDFDIGAFACTSRGQAYRAGRWALLSERLETEIVNFDAAMDGCYSRPGDIVEIYDNFRLAQKQGGRVFDMFTNKTNVILDRAVEYDGAFSYELSLNIPKANRDPGYTGSDSTQNVTNSSQIDSIRASFIETQTVSSLTLSGDKTVAVVNSAFSEQYIGGTWILKATHPTSGVIGAKQYRVLNTKENEDKNISITALEYSASKFDASEQAYTIRTSPVMDYGSTPIASPSNLVLSQVFTYQGQSFTAYIGATWTPSTGPFLANHTASGRNIATGSWFPLQVFNNGTSANYFPSATGTYEIIVGANQVGGGVAAPISATINFGQSNPLGNDVIPLQEIKLLNRVPGTVNKYAERQAAFMIQTAPSGADGTDQRRAFLEGMLFRFKDSASVPVSDWFFVRENESIVIPYSFTGIAGWPFRSGTIEAKAVDFWNNSSASQNFAFENPAPPLAALNVVNKDKNSFTYILDPIDTMPTDFSGVAFWTNTIPSRSTNPNFIKNGMNGQIIHNLDSDNVYAWWAMVDTFGFENLNVAGPYLLQTGPLGEDIAGLTLSRSGHLDSWGNEYNTLYATWNRVNSGDIRDYMIYLQNNSGEKYDYIISQTPSGEDPFFHFDSVIPDRTYQVAVKSRNGEGRMSSLSAYTGGVFVPKPKIRYLQVEGKSYFFEPTAVRLSTQGVSGNQTIDFGQGNIMRVNLTNSATATVSPINIQSGATYLMYVYRQANAGDVIFNNFKWPDGEAPEFTTDAGAVDVISAFAIDSGNLYAVAVNNMS